MKLRLAMLALKVAYKILTVAGNMVDTPRPAKTS
jgi:hypothetical protein